MTRRYGKWSQPWTGRFSLLLSADWPHVRGRDDYVVPLFIRSQLVVLDVQVERGEIDLQRIHISKLEIGEVCDQLPIDSAGDAPIRFSSDSEGVAVQRGAARAAIGMSHRLADILIAVP